MDGVTTRQVLFRHAVDASWATQVTKSGCFVGVLVHDISLGHVSNLSFDQLVKARDDEKLELISIAVGTPDDGLKEV
jgi:hypothetical protein